MRLFNENVPPDGEESARKVEESETQLKETEGLTARKLSQEGRGKRRESECEGGWKGEKKKRAGLERSKWRQQGK